jgi:hypothetical protein
METYILIAICYGWGCYLSYKLGWNKGANKAGWVICRVLGKHLKISPDAIAADLLKMAQQQKEKLS